MHVPDAFNPWVDRLAAASNTHIAGYADFHDALRRRHDFFHKMGCRLSDHGLNFCYSDPCPEQVAVAIFDKARAGQAVTTRGAGAVSRPALMLFFGRLDAEKGWTKQLHLGARRNANSRAFAGHRPGHRFRLDRRLAAGRSLGDTWTCWIGRYAPEDDRLQPEPRRQLCRRHDGREFPGRTHPGEDPVRQRLVVPGSEGRDGVADQRALERRPALEVGRHADRFAIIHVISTTRVLPACAMQRDRQGHGEW